VEAGVGKEGRRTEERNGTGRKGGIDDGRIYI
jgi:hypothetical protein